MPAQVGQGLAAEAALVSFSAAMNAPLLPATNVVWLLQALQTGERDIPSGRSQHSHLPAQQHLWRRGCQVHLLAGSLHQRLQPQGTCVRAACQPASLWAAGSASSCCRLQFSGQLAGRTKGAAHQDAGCRAARVRHYCQCRSCSTSAASAASADGPSPTQLVSCGQPCSRAWPGCTDTCQQDRSVAPAPHGHAGRPYAGCSNQPA